MGDRENQQLAQAAEENAQLQSDLDRLQGQFDTLSSEFSAYQEKADRAIEFLGNQLLKLHGKDGIKVNWPVISMERDLGAALDALTPTVALDVNLIVNGTTAVVSDALNELPDEEEE